MIRYVDYSVLAEMFAFGGVSGLYMSKSDGQYFGMDIRSDKTVVKGFDTAKECFCFLKRRSCL